MTISSSAAEYMTLNVKHLSLTLNNVGNTVRHDIDVSKPEEVALFVLVRNFSPMRVRRGIHRGIACD